MLELRTEDGMWGMVKESEAGREGRSEQSAESTSTSATVTVEHVAVHTEQLSSDRVIVLSKVTVIPQPP